MADDLIAQRAAAYRPVNYAEALERYRAANALRSGNAYGGEGQQTLQDFAVAHGLGAYGGGGADTGPSFSSTSPYLTEQFSGGADTGGRSWVLDNQGYADQILSGMDPTTISRVSGPAAQYFGAVAGNPLALGQDFIKYMDVKYGPGWESKLSQYAQTRPPGTENIDIGGSHYGAYYYPAYGVGTGLKSQFSDDPAVQDYLSAWMGGVENYAAGSEHQRRAGPSPLDHVLRAAALIGGAYTGATLGPAVAGAVGGGTGGAIAGGAASGAATGAISAAGQKLTGGDADILKGAGVGAVAGGAGGGLSSFLSPTLGRFAPIVSSVITGVGKSLLSNSVMGGALDTTPTQGAGSSTQPTQSGTQEITTPITSQPPLSESVMSTNARRPPLIRLSPGFRRGY